MRGEQDGQEKAEADKKRRQKQTVKWVLDTPRRLQILVDQERQEEAEKEWEQVSSILEQWEGVTGVDELREECEAIMHDEDSE